MNSYFRIIGERHGLSKCTNLSTNPKLHCSYIVNDNLTSDEFPIEAHPLTWEEFQSDVDEVSISHPKLVGFVHDCPEQLGVTDDDDNYNIHRRTSLM